MPGLVPEATGQPGGGFDPLGMANSLMDFQNKANQNRKFQAEFMANQALGETIAHAGSLEDGLNQAQQNPLIMGFGGQGVQTARAMQLLQYQGSEVKQKLGQSGMETAVQAGLQAAQDPMNYSKYFDNGMKLVDPLVQARVKPMVDSVKGMIADKIRGLDLTNPADLQTAKSRIMAAVGGAYVGAGGDPSRLATYLPDVSVDASGVPMAVPSTIERAQGAVPTPVSQTGAGVPSAPAPGSGVTTNSATGQKMDATADVSPWVETNNATGQPLVDTHGNMRLKPGHVEQDAALKKDHAGPELDKYTMASNLISSTNQTDAAAIALAKKGGFTVPGFMGDVRGAISNAVETIQNITGKKLVDDAELPAANANVSVINKWQHATTFQMKNMLESTGARGLGVLMEAAGAVPGMNNTPLSFLVLNSGLRALADWEVGKYEFKNKYMQNPAGTLLGADEQYMRQSPPLNAARQELAKFGMTLDGKGLLTFNSKKELDNAAGEGLLGEGEAGKALYKDFYKKLAPTQ